MITDCLAVSGPRIHRRADDAPQTLCGRKYGGSTNGYNGEPCTDCAAIETGPTAGPRFPAGTPEYEAYLAELRTELTKFAAGEGEKQIIIMLRSFP